MKIFPESFNPRVLALYFGSILGLLSWLPLLLLFLGRLTVDTIQIYTPLCGPPLVLFQFIIILTNKIDLTVLNFSLIKIWADKLGLMALNDHRHILLPASVTLLACFIYYFFPAWGLLTLWGKMLEKDSALIWILFLCLALGFIGFHCWACWAALAMFRM